MINFRYHVVSLVAVFLALGMGVLAASAFINGAIVQQLEKTQRNQGTRIGKLQDDVLRLENDKKADEQFATAIRPAILHDRLQDKRVVLLGFESTSGEVFDGVVEAFKETAGEIDGVFILSEKLDLSSAAARQQAAEVAESTDDGAKALQPVLVQRMAESLAGTKKGFLQRLVDGGLARTRPVDGVALKKPIDLSAPDTAVVILCPGNGSKLGKPDTFLLPLSASLSAANPPVRLVIGEAGHRDLKTLPQLRSNGTLKAATVDGTDAVMGQVSLVLALEAMYRGQIGHYGTGENATSVLPEIAATPSPVAR